MSVETLNPYASKLGDRDPLETIAATAKHLQRLADEISPARMNEPRAPGKWSARQILCHLADCEITFAFRLRQAVAEEHHVIQPFDQDQWAMTYGAYDSRAALAVFSAVRNWNVLFIRSLTPEQLAKSVTHPERGTMTLKTIVETMAGHDINHLRQIEAIAGRVAAAS
jgi:uncharacterized damage-inducible protein DinB